MPSQRSSDYITFVSTSLRRKKFEIATDEVGNFIKQDEKKGVLREVSVEAIDALSHQFRLDVDGMSPSSFIISVQEG